MKKFLKTITFLFIFGIISSFLVYFSLNVDAADTKYIDIVTGTGRELGDEVRIGDEHFYILSNNGVEIRMLAKYNVDISAKCSLTYNAPSSTGVGYDPKCGIRASYTGLQDPSITGYPDEATGDVIGVPFSTELQHGATNLDYEGGVAEIYVNEYVDTINKKYNINVTGDLLDLQTFNKLFYGVDMQKAPENIRKFFNVTSWTKVPTQDKKIMILESTAQSYFSFEHFLFYGIRPVIIAPASALNTGEEPRACDGVFCFTDKDKNGKVSISDEICIKDECFYVLSNKNNKVQLLAKYNLNLGLDCSKTTNYGDMVADLSKLSCKDISGKDWKQDSMARGYIAYPNGTIASYGGVEYTNTVQLFDQDYPPVTNNYDESVIKKNVDKYVDYINSLVDGKFTGSLLALSDLTNATGATFDQLTNPTPKTVSSLDIRDLEVTGVGTTYYYLYQMNSIPDWVYANSYWTRSGTNENTVYAISSNGLVSDYEMSTLGEFGVRPLLTVELDEVPAVAKDFSGCYKCGDELVWTSDPDESSCELRDDITDKKMCVNNPKTGITNHTIQILIVISVLVIALAIISKQNRFKKI